MIKKSIITSLFCVLTVGITTQSCSPDDEQENQTETTISATGGGLDNTVDPDKGED